MSQPLSFGKSEVKSYGNSKIDPSFKSKRYRDKLRTEIKGLEVLIPIDRSSLHRKLDSQTVFRLCISFFRLKILFKALSLEETTDNEQEETRSDKPDVSKQNPETLFAGHNVFQILDGFLIAATTDGTILYSSDNVLQYLGFNQVDLMHRCMYGVVHPDDHYDLKYILEHTAKSFPSQRSDGHKDNEEYFTHDKRVEFMCRMKCFNGTTAGYLKVHCSGRARRIPDITSKSMNNVPQVLLLFCQPFMLTGNDFTHDVKQNVFWSKHDMDLTIRELDKKTEELVGYKAEELNGQSFYSIIHPEDLATFATCHKTLMESTEVQTAYFRLHSKSGEWVWMHSRGKVISKNSKKFSIVFTHCPVRLEDSTFLQQETNLRRRYAIQDLLYFTQYGGYTNFMAKTNTTSEDSFQGSHKTGDLSTPYLGFTEDVSMSFYSQMEACPSSWHAMSDRHSPVLPSTHVAHKITQREKQVQFQEFRRRQRYEKQLNTSPQFPVCNPYIERQQMPVLPNDCYAHGPKQIKLEPTDDSYNPPCYNPQQQDGITSGHACHYYNEQQQPPSIPPPPPYPYNFQYHSRFSLPPSPPISPHHCFMYNEIDTRHVHRLQAPLHSSRYVPPTHVTNPLTFSNQVQNNIHNLQEMPLNCWQNHSEESHVYKPQANLRVSMHCDYGDARNYNVSTDGVITTSQNHVFPVNYVQIGHIRDQTCAVSNKPKRENIVKYDIEASIHMKIVENPSCRNNSIKQEVDLPSIGSFLEYLNDG